MTASEPDQPAGEIRIDVSVHEDGIATLSWATATDVATLSRAIGVVGDESLLGHGLRRLEISLPAADRMGRRATVRAGFRQEGVRRQAHLSPDGSHDDVIVYARLASDEVAGPSAFSAVMNTVLPRKRMIGHVVIRDHDDRILLCRTSFKTDWELPGGIVEPGETPRAAAARELTEELGVEWPIGPVMIVDWMPPYLGWEDACELIFDGGRIGADELHRFTPDGQEIVEIALCTLERARELVTPLSHRRLVLASSLEPGRTVYTEDGIQHG